MKRHCGCIETASERKVGFAPRAFSVMRPFLKVRFDIFVVMFD